MSPHRLTLEQAADFLQMDTSELMSMAVQGEIPCQQQGKRFFFEQDSLDAWCSQKIINHSVSRKKNNDKKKKAANPRTTVPEEAEEEPIIAQLCMEELMEPNMQAKSMPAVLSELVKLAENSGYLYDPQDLATPSSASQSLSSLFSSDRRPSTTRRRIFSSSSAALTATCTSNCFSASAFSVRKPLSSRIFATRPPLRK